MPGTESIACVWQSPYQNQASGAGTQAVSMWRVRKEMVALRVDRRRDGPPVRSEIGHRLWMQEEAVCTPTQRIGPVLRRSSTRF